MCVLFEVVRAQQHPQCEHRHAEFLGAEDARHRLDSIRLDLLGADLVGEEQTLLGERLD